MHKLTIKLFLADGQSIQHGQIVPVFHSWIQSHAIEDHLVIDVADYEHVPNGPGTVLVTHEANFYLDQTAGRPGLVYQRKQPLEGALPEKITTAIRHTLAAAHRLETYPGLKFKTNELSIKFADRLNAPNTPQTLATIKPAVEAVGNLLFNGQKFEVVNPPDPRALFELQINAASSPSLNELLARLSPVQTTP